MSGYADILPAMAEIFQAHDEVRLTGGLLRDLNPHGGMHMVKENWEWQAAFRWPEQIRYLCVELGKLVGRPIQCIAINDDGSLQAVFKPA